MGYPHWPVIQPFAPKGEIIQNGKRFGWERMRRFGLGHKLSVLDLIQQGNLGLRNPQDQDLSPDFNQGDKFPGSNRFAG
jgi:hypothetical protein